MTRPLSVIAHDIYKAWPKVNFAAKPYLEAIISLNKITDTYYADDARTVVLYFLANTSSFRGEQAKVLKAELRAILAAV